MSTYESENETDSLHYTELCRRVLKTMLISYNTALFETLLIGIGIKLLAKGQKLI